MTTNLSVPHRLRALADGEVLKVASVFGWEPFDKRNLRHLTALFSDFVVFRIKPEPEMSVPVRRYLWRQTGGEVVVCDVTNRSGVPVGPEGSGFIRWLDDDYVSYPVEVQE